MPPTPRFTDILITAIAPAVWGSTYIVTTQLLPPDYPLNAALLRALPAGLLLLLLSRQLPTGHWWWKVFVLGALNIAIFWWLLFIAAYRLPGGIAAVVGAIQPLIVVFISRLVLRSPIRLLSIFAAGLGTCGVALLILTPAAGFDFIGIIAGLGGAISMALGVVLTRKWQPKAPLLTFTGWQLAAGGILLLPAALIWEPPLPELTMQNIVGFLYLGLIGSALTYAIWFRGIARLTPNIVSPLGFLSPTTAVLLGWLILRQQLQLLQLFGFLMVFISIMLAASQRVENRP